MLLTKRYSLALEEREKLKSDLASSEKRFNCAATLANELKEQMSREKLAGLIAWRVAHYLNFALPNVRDSFHSPSSEWVDSVIKLSEFAIKYLPSEYELSTSSEIQHHGNDDSQ